MLIHHYLRQPRGENRIGWACGEHKDCVVDAEAVLDHLRENPYDGADTYRLTKGLTGGMAGFLADQVWLRGQLTRHLVRLASSAPTHDDVHLPMQELIPLPAVDAPGKIIAVGLNFRSHLEEAVACGEPVGVPEKPFLFPKINSTVLADGKRVVHPIHGNDLDFEVELAIVIGTRCSDVPYADALSVVAGYAVANDLSLRDILFRPNGLFEAKNFDGFCPLSSVLATPESVADPDSLVLSMTVNGQRRQHESMAGTFFDCRTVISHATSRMSFSPGDIILCGTPAGVAAFSDASPKPYLREGDVMTASIQGVGSVTTHVAHENATKETS